MPTCVATASAGHRVVASSKVEVTIESRRYPFCFFGEEKSADATRGILHYLPFNQRLNRFELSVNGELRMQLGQERVLPEPIRRPASNDERRNVRGGGEDTRGNGDGARSRDGTHLS